MEINATKTVKVNVKKLSIHMKVRDEFCCQILDSEGEELKDYEGYVPSFMPGDNMGDYLILDIDIDTGLITNWKKIESDEIERFINDYKGE